MMNETNYGTVHLLVKGKVQGVFYRASAKKAADNLGVTGWVKNTASGDVEIMASAPGKALETFIEWCKQGPPQARVREVVTEPRDECTFPDFTIVR